MKKKLFNLFFMLGLMLTVSVALFSCSDKDEPIVPDPDPAPVVPDPDPELPENPTPIQWVENEVDGGERGVGIKVTRKDERNFVFECTPGDKIQSYRLDVYPLSRMYNYLLESVGAGVKATDEEVEDLIVEAIYNSSGSGGYTFSEATLGDSYPRAEFDWANTAYSQSEIVPDGEYLIITIGCNDKDGNNPADMKICYIKTPVKELIGNPRVDIDVTTSYTAAGIQYIPNADAKYFYQFCLDAEPIDAYINAYGKKMYRDFLRHTTITAEDAQVSQEELYYLVDFGYGADATKLITATSVGLDANKTPTKDYIRQDFHLKEINPDAEEAECSLTVDKVGASVINMNVRMENNCVAMFYNILSASEWASYENADEATLTALAQKLDQEGFGIKNTNFAQGGSFTGTRFDFDMSPSSNLAIVYVGRNEYGQISKIKATPFTTKARVRNTPEDSEAEIGINITEAGRTNLKVEYTYNEKTAVYYHQYIMTPDLLEPGNEQALINYLLSGDANVWPADQVSGVDGFNWDGLQPGTEYTFACVGEDWNGVLTEVKTVTASTEKIIAGPNPTMRLNAYMSDLGNFTVQYSIVKDVAKFKYMIIEETYSADGDYSYSECLSTWKEQCIENGLESYNSVPQSYDKTSSAKRLVALCVPLGEKDGKEVIGDLYTVFWDKDKGIITDPSVLFPDAPKAAKKTMNASKPQVVKKDRRLPVDVIIKEKMDMKNAPGVVRSGNTILLDMKKLGKHPHAK